MRLALILGVAQGKAVKPRLMSVKDNLDIDCFDSIPSFIDSSLKRNCIYDRILILSTMLNKVASEDLYNYWAGYSRDTSIVLLCKKGKDDTVANKFMNLFITPLVAVMMVDNTTVQLLSEAVLLPTHQITDKYGIKDYLSLEVDEDKFEVEEPKEDIEAKPKVEDNIPVEPEKKRSLWSALFGTKKDKSVPNNQKITSEIQTEKVNIEDDVNSNQIHKELSNNDTAIKPIEEVSDTVNENLDTVDEKINESQDTVENSNINTDDSSLEEENCSKDVFEDNSSNIDNDGFEDYTEPINQFEPETFEVDEDFGDSVDYTAVESENKDRGTSFETTEVDMDMSSVDITREENKYRQSTEQPKVITKEIIRNVGSSYNVLSSVYSGRLKKIIVVTGDRGTGVTSTALNLAKTFSKKVPVLYFDCDTENHGLLSYIDYSTFRDYEPIHMQGVKLCKNSVAFRNCVCSYDTNLDILTTDYSCDVSEEELITAQGVVAEQSTDYGVVIVDCPVSRLHCISDLILTGVSIVCVEYSKRGFMNMLCRLEASPLELRYKRNIVSKGTIFVTKFNNKIDKKKLLGYVNSIFEHSGSDWLSMRMREFNGKLTDKLLNEILEG